MQDEVIAFLNSAAGHPGGGPVEMVQTHGAVIFLAGDVALKIKRAVRYDYMDLSTLELRRAMLQRELELNQPVAPQIYRDVVAVTRAPDGTLALNGTGDPVEWVLRMWRFPARDELSVIAQTKGIDDRLAADLGTGVFAYHADTPLRDCDGARLIREILDELDRVFADMGPQLGARRIGQFSQEARAELARVAQILQHRSTTGHVRRCHGDLHLRNLVLLNGKPVPFDALEFDETLGTCDVLYDLAFLLMDLRHHCPGRAANITLNSYLLAAGGGEDKGLAALPLFLAVRAAIRAMVLVQTAMATDAETDPAAVQFLDIALASLHPNAASLVLIGGMSGSGKTTIAKTLAPMIGVAPGAVHLRSDTERKAMQGLDPTAPLDPRHYAKDRRDAVYDRIFQRAAQILATGHSVLIDATFLDPATRATAQEMAEQTGVPLRSLWLDAPLAVLIDRVEARSGDASDADADVVRHQAIDHALPADWTRIESTGTIAQTLERAAAALGVTGCS